MGKGDDGERERLNQTDDKELSYGEIADKYDDTVVVTTTRLMTPPSQDQTPKSVGPPLNVEVREHHIWSPIKPEPPPKPEGVAVKVIEHVMPTAGPRQKGPPSIGSIDPSRRKR